MATGTTTSGLEIPHAGNQDSANFTESGEINMANVRQYISSLYVVLLSFFGFPILFFRFTFLFYIIVLCVFFFFLFETKRFPKWRERLTLNTIRPLPVFLGVTGPSICFSPEAFTPPAKKLMDKTAPEKFLTRIRLNFAFFLTNYALISVGTASIVALMHPKMMVFLAITWGLWSLHIAMIQKNISFFDHTLTVERRSLLLSILTSIVVIRFCFIPFIITIGLSLFIVLSHAIMRDPKHIESSMNMFDRHRGAEDSDSASDDDEVEEGEMI